MINQPSPIDFVFNHMTSILSHQLTAAVSTKSRCSCCQRLPSEFGYQALLGKDGYKRDYSHCKSCESFNVTDIELVGIEKHERLVNGVKVGSGHTFGMMKGSGALIEASGRVTLFLPPNTYKKFPPKIREFMQLIECSQARQIDHIIKMDLVFPLVYIEDFGRKTYDLIRGLTYSASRDELFLCSDRSISSFTKPSAVLNLDALQEALSIKQALLPKEWSRFYRAVKALSVGVMSPMEFTAEMADLNSEPLMKVFSIMPKDPHLRLLFLSKINSLTSPE